VLGEMTILPMFEQRIGGVIAKRGRQECPGKQYLFLFDDCWALEAKSSAYLPFRFPSLLLRDSKRLEIEEKCYWLIQALRHAFQLFERRSISTSFYEAQKIHRHSNFFRETFLCLARLISDLLKPEAKLLAKSVRMGLHQSRVWRNVITSTTE
jgi:hypothetical protein